MSEFMMTGFVAGLMGAALYEVSRWVGLSRRRTLPVYMFKLHYWILTIVQILAGAVAAAYLTSGGANAFLVGLAGPSLLSRLGALVLEKAHLSADRGAEFQASAADWFRG
jgi:hypothetical protein